MELSKRLATGVQPIITMSRFAGLVDIMKLQELLDRNCTLHMCPYIHEENVKGELTSAEREPITSQRSPYVMKYQHLIARLLYFL